MDHEVDAVGRLDGPAVEPESGAQRQRPGRGNLGAALRVVDLDIAFVVATLVALVVFLSFASPFFLTERNLSNVLLQVSVLAAVSFGVTIVIIAGHFDLSVGSGVAIVMVVGALVMRDTGSVGLGLLAGLATGLAVGLTSGVLVAVVRVPSFIATLGMLVIARGIARALSGGRTVAGVPNEFIDFMNASFLGLRLSVWVTLLVLVVFHVTLRHTRLGIQIYAVGGNPAAARLSGLRVARVQIAAFTMSAVAFSVAGLGLLGRLGSAQPNSGSLLELYSVAAVVLGGTSLYGGKGSVLRTLLGVLLIAVIQNGLNLLNVSSDLQMVLLGAVFILAAASGVLQRRGS
jgi:ribose transport system permease protein